MWCALLDPALAGAYGFRRVSHGPPPQTCQTVSRSCAAGSNRGGVGGSSPLLDRGRRAHGSTNGTRHPAPADVPDWRAHPFRVDARVYTIVKVGPTSAYGTRGEPMSLAAQIWVALAITLHILVLSWVCDALVRFLFGEDDR